MKSPNAKSTPGDVPKIGGRVLIDGPLRPGVACT
jgi:hypothetical protein